MALRFNLEDEYFTPLDLAEARVVCLSYPPAAAARSACCGSAQRGGRAALLLPSLFVSLVSPLSLEARPRRRLP